MVLEEDRTLNETTFSYGENNGLFSVEYTPDWEIGFVKMVSPKTVFCNLTFMDINYWLFGVSSELSAATIWKFHFHYSGRSACRVKLLLVNNWRRPWADDIYVLAVISRSRAVN